MFDATKINPDNWDGIQKCRKKPIVVRCVQMMLPEGFYVDTLEGRMTGKEGDYLMIGVNSEKYPCKKEIFEATYDIVEGGE